MKEGKFEIEFKGKHYPAFYVQNHDTAFEILKQLLNTKGWFGFDTETCALKEYKHIKEAALSPRLSRMRTLQLFTGKSSIVFDLRSIKKSKPENAPNFGFWFNKLVSGRTLVGHYALFDICRLINELGIHKLDVRCSWILSKILLHATFPTDSNTRASLKDMVRGIFDIDIKKECSSTDWGTPELTFEQVEYAALDPLCCLLIYEHLYKSVDKFKVKRYLELCEAAQWPIARMQLNGIKFDVNAHREVVMVEWRKKLYEARLAVQRMTGLEDVTGPKLVAWFKQHMSPEVLALWPTTEKGEISVSANALVDLSHLEVVKPFAEYQKLKTLCSGFGMKLIEQVCPESRRLHSTFWICGARTGRLSSSEPNLQNAPRDKVMRSHFVAAKGKIFLVADYSQIEVRTAAELSRDKELLRCFEKGVDVHRRTVSDLLGKPAKEITKEERQFGKSLVFGSLYGIGPRSFVSYAKKGYGVTKSEKEARSAIQHFRDLYCGYYDWAMANVEKAQKRKWVRTVCGKHRCLDPENAYGASLNTPIQGSAAECMLHALIRLDVMLSPREKLVNCVHDEVILEVDNNKDSIENASKKIEKAMRLGFLDVFPMGCTKEICEVTIGSNWAEAKA